MPWWKRSRKPAPQPEPDPRWQPGWVSAPGISAPEYRAQLIADLCAQSPDAPEAYARIQAEFAKLPTEADREHAPLHEVRYLQTYLMAPHGPGHIVDVGGPSVHNVPLAQLKGWEIDTVEILSIDYETDPLPYPDASQDGVLLCEVIEHFVLDPMFCLMEINRILKPGGFLVVTTPNVASWFAVFQALQQQAPNRWAFYSGDPSKARNHIHAREYLVSDFHTLLPAAGFEVEDIVTRDYGVHPPYCPIPGYSEEDRGDTIFCRARKTGAPVKRFVSPPYLEDEDI